MALQSTLGKRDVLAAKDPSHLEWIPAYSSLSHSESLLFDNENNIVPLKEPPAYQGLTVLSKASCAPKTKHIKN